MDEDIDTIVDNSIPRRTCLKWKKHQSTIVSCLASFLDKKTLVDVTLVSMEGTRIQAHKIILSACSPYFQAVFENNPCKHPVVILKDIQFAVLRSIVNFIYSGEVCVDSNELKEDTYQTAAALQIKGLNKDDLTVYEVDGTKVGERCSSSNDGISSSSTLSLRTPSPQPPLDLDISTPSVFTRTPTPATEYVGSILNDYSVKGKLNRKNTGDVILLSSDPSKSSESTFESDVETSSRRSTLKQSSSDTSSNGKSSFVIKSTLTKKKDVWVDPDAISQKKASKNSKRSKLKQRSLLSMAMHYPKPKMDLSKHKDYNGGIRSASQSTSDTSLGSYQEGEKKTTKSGTKRKSDDSIEGDDEKSSPSLDMSDTYFDISPMKQSTAFDRCSLQPTSPIQGTSKLKDTKNHHKPKPLSPLSPGRMNIVEPAELAPDKAKARTNKPVSSKDHLDSTLNLLRDFDKIPEYKTPSPKKLQSKRGNDQQELKCTCKEQQVLGSYVDEKDLSRTTKCPIHQSGYQPLRPFETPENFWCTVQYNNTQEMYDKGLFKVGTPFTPPPPRRRRRSSNETFIDTENDLDI